MNAAGFHILGTRAKIHYTWKGRKDVRSTGISDDMAAKDG
jgi:hypothetical protein